MGTPVVVSDLGAVPETVLRAAGRARRASAPAGACRRATPAALAEAVAGALSLGASAREALSRRARAHVERHFSLERMVAATLDVYRGPHREPVALRVRVDFRPCSAKGPALILGRADDGAAPAGQGGRLGRREAYGPEEIEAIRRPMRAAPVPQKEGPRANRDIRGVRDVQLIDQEGQNRGVVPVLRRPADRRGGRPRSRRDRPELRPRPSASSSITAASASTSRRSRPRRARSRRPSRSRRSSSGPASTTTITTSR